MVERERRALAIVDAPPKDRTVSRYEAERFLVELYRTGMKYMHIGQRTNCTQKYVREVVRRRAPELARIGEGRGKKTHPLGPLLDIRELRKAWHAEEHRRQGNRQDAGMLAAYRAGDSLADISRRENIPRIRAWERISATSPKPLPRSAFIARGNYPDFRN